MWSKWAQGCWDAGGPFGGGGLGAGARCGSICPTCNSVELISIRNACKDVEVVTFDELLGKLRMLAQHLAPVDPVDIPDISEEQAACDLE